MGTTYETEGTRAWPERNTNQNIGKQQPRWMETTIQTKRNNILEGGKQQEPRWMRTTT
jgi:hypothetical protein